MIHSVLKTHELSKVFVQGSTTIEVLKKITVSFEQGKTYAVTGVSGSGKSTLLNLLAGLDTPTTGAVFFCEKNTTHFTQHEREFFLNRSIGLLFQQPHLITELSAAENIMIPGLIRGFSMAECVKKADFFLEMVGLLDKKKERPGSLSGGQQQRVSLARALFNEPNFLLADEPTGNLDIKTGSDMVKLLEKCQQEWGMGIIVSTHDDYVAHAFDVLYEIVCGHLVHKK